MLEKIFQTPSYDIQSIYFTHRDGKKIYAELYMPKDKTGARSLVILGHGYTSSYYMLKGYAEYLSLRNIACCIFDFCGGSNYSRSDGSMLEMSVLTQAEDMKLLMGELKKNGDFTPDRLYTGGESQGGLVAALVAAELPSEIAGLILLYPALYIPDIMRKQFPDRSSIPAHITQLGATVGRQYADDVYDLDVYCQIAKYTGMVLILHGSNDNMVPLHYSQKAEQEYKNARLVVLPGAGHGIYSGAAMRTACKEIEDFITRKEKMERDM